MTRRRYELSDGEWSIIERLLPDKPWGGPRVGDRRVLNGVLWRFVPVRHGLKYRKATAPRRPLIRWRKAGVWDRLLLGVSAAFEGEIVLIDSTCVRVHQHGATGKKGDWEIAAWDVPEAALRAKSMPSLTLEACSARTRSGPIRIASTHPLTCFFLGRIKLSELGQQPNTWR